MTMNHQCEWYITDALKQLNDSTYISNSEVNVVYIDKKVFSSWFW